MSIRWLGTIHPVLITSEGLSLDEKMKTALFLAVAACLFLMAVLVLLRTAILLHEEDIQELHENTGGGLR